MKIEWKGHSSFLFTTEKGITILTDPFNEKVGYPIPKVEAKYVTVSHEHFDHNATHLVEGNPQVLRKAGKWQFDDVTFQGINTYHDEDNGAKRGANTIFVIKTEGLTLCHLGDLGHLLTPEQVKEIGSIDVLCVPVGGFFTIDAEKAMATVKQLKPRIVLPMHYKYDQSIELPIAEVEDFTKLWNKINYQSVLDISAALLPKTEAVYIFELK